MTVLMIHAGYRDLVACASMAQREAAVRRELSDVAKQRRPLNHVLGHRDAHAAYERDDHQPGARLASLGTLGDWLANGSEVLVKGQYCLVPDLIQIAMMPIHSFSSSAALIG